MVPTRSRSQLSAAVVALALVAAACSSANPSTQVASDATATSYLADVEATEKDFEEAFTRLDDATSQAYSTRSVLFEAVAETDFTQAGERALEEAEAATPPDYLAADHEAWLAFRSAITDINDDGLALALGNEDLQLLLSVNTKANQARGTMLRDTSREFCLAATTDTDDLCAASNTLPGGDYGQTTYEVFRIGALSNLGLFFFPEALTDEERSVQLEQVQPLIETSLATTRDDLAAITPPSEFQADHEAFVQFFTAQYELATRITKANAERDANLLAELFAESGENARFLDETLSGALDEIAAPFFAGS